VQEQFRFSVNEMSALARTSGIPLFWVLPASNLRDWRPEASVWDDRLPERPRAERDAAALAARRLQAEGDLAGALAATDQALALDPSPASLYFLRGQLLLQLQQPGALAALRQARDRDAVPIRITSPLLQILRATAAAGPVPALDAEAALAAASPHGIVGSEMVLDYCHPSPEGHRRIAALLLPAISRQLWPTDPAPRVDAAALLPAGGEGADALSSAFGAAWAGQMQVRQGRLPEAAVLFRRALALDPGLATAHEGLGRVLAARGDTDAAIAELEEATRLAPDLANGWNNLGQAYRAANRLEEALAAYRRALRTGVGSGVVHRNLAATLLSLGRPEEALQEATEATRVSPGDALAWVSVGAAATALGRLGLAREAYEKARRLDPGVPMGPRAPRAPEAPPASPPSN